MPWLGRGVGVPGKALLLWKQVSSLNMHICHVLGTVFPGSWAPGGVGHFPGGRESEGCMLLAHVGRRQTLEKYVHLLVQLLWTGTF